MAIKINGNTVIADNQNITSTGTISATGNITTSGAIIGNVVSTGPISTTGNVTGGNLVTGGILTATGDIYGAKVYSVSGDIGTPDGVTTLRLGNSNPTTIFMGGNASNIFIGNVSSNTCSVLISGPLGVAGTSNLANLNVGGIVSTFGNIIGGQSLQISGNIFDTVELNITTQTGNLVLNPAGNISCNNHYITGLLNPASSQDAATKFYVDNAVSTAISYHQPVLAATTDTLANTTGGTITYNNGNAGVGASLTTTGSFNLIDTANVQTANTRILVKNEANATLNGVYVWSNATTIVRSTDTNTYGAGNVDALGLNDYFFVSGGNVNKGSAYVVSGPTGTITFGTSNITFAQFSSSQTYTANTQAGISLNGTVINALVDGITTAFTGSGEIGVKASANLTTPNIGAATGTSLSATGNITGGNLTTFGRLFITAGTDTISMSSGAVSASGDITGGNIRTAGLISATGNLTAGNIFTSGTGAFGYGGSPGIYGMNIDANGAITTNSGFGFISAGGNVTGSNLLTSGLISAAGNITGGNINAGFGDIKGGNIQGFGLILSGVGTITTPGNISATGTATLGNIFTTGVISAAGTATVGNLFTTGLISATGNITAGNLSITGVILDTGNITGGNILTGGLISSSGNITTSASLVTGTLTLTGNTVIGPGNITIDPAGAGAVDGNVIIAGNLVVQGTTTTINSNVITTNDLVFTLANNAATSTAANGAGLSVGPTSGPYATFFYSSTQSNWTTGLGISATGTVTAGNVITGGQVSAIGNVSGGNLNVTGNIVDTGALSIITGANGNLTLNAGTGFIIASSSILNGQANGVGNIGNSTGYFNTIFAKATSAQYADLAEKYTADADYEPGTVVMFGGSAEVTLCVADGCSRVAGVISTNPSYIMNGTLDATHVATVALTGRVPTKVTGTVRKGDLMVSAGNGTARAEANPRVGTVIGKALADSEGDAVIEVVVGRF